MANRTISLNPSQLKLVPLYLRHDDFIDGQVEAVQKYLVRHISEYSQGKTKDGGTVGAKAWNNRLEFLANDNFCESGLMHWLSYLTQSITPGAGLDSDLWAEILSDMDGEELKIENFIRDLFWYYLGYGQVGILVEGPSAIAKDKESAKAAGERSFATIYEPWRILSLTRWKTFGPRKGKLSEVVIYLDSVQSQTNTRKTVVRRYWMESQTSAYACEDLILNKDIFAEISGLSTTIPKSLTQPIEVETAKEATQGALSEIPFVILGHGPQEDSVLFSVVPRNREHLNKKSHKDTIDRNQAFKKIAFFGADPQNVGETWNENSALFFDNEKASMAVVEPGNPQSLNEDLDRIKREALLVCLLRMARMHQENTKQVESFESKQEDNSSFEKYLDGVCETVQQATNKALALMHFFETSAPAEPDKIRIDIGRKFKVAASENERSITTLLVSLLRDFQGKGDTAPDELIAELVITLLAEQRLVSDSVEGEASRKKDLMERLRKIALKGLTNPRDLATISADSKSSSVLDRANQRRQQSNGNNAQDS